jgi:acetylglutamate kinase
VKFGGELLDDSRWRFAAASALAGRRLVVVHGGGREIDAALTAAGIPKRQIDGLRITDEQTLDIVVSVLAGSVNTSFVASLVAAGVPAVGLTGADAACGLAVPAPPHRAVDGRTVDLGRVGVPHERSDVRLLRTLLDAGFVPVVACLGVDERGALYNVNADTLAGHLAARLAACRLVIASTTAGVLDSRQQTIAELDAYELERLISSGTATAGMIAKLRACERALAAGVDEVVIVDGHDIAGLAAAFDGDVPEGATRVTRAEADGREMAKDRTIRAAKQEQQLQ